ncbi:MAG: glyoxylase I family protein [Candidatus Azotimanducaceae bacterium]|jgi:glyoxylase I family protein
MSRPFSVLGLDHVVLRVRDLDTSRHFYTEILGCPEERSIEDLGLYQLRAGKHLIDLVLLGSTLGGKEPVNQSSANQDHFCIEISPFNAVELQRYLNSHGVDCPEPGTRYGARGQGPSIYITDPDGNTVELKGPAEA